MIIHENQNNSMNINGNKWKSIEMMEINGHPWIPEVLEAGWLAQDKPFGPSPILSDPRHRPEFAGTAKSVRAVRRRAARALRL